MVEQLSQAERDDALEGLPEWDHDTGRDAITRSFTFDDFSQAFAFMTQVALLAEFAGFKHLLRGSLEQRGGGKVRMGRSLSSRRCAAAPI